MNKALVLICAIVILAAGQAFAAKVTNVELSWQNGYTVARLDVQGAVRFSHQTEQAKDGKPFRVIVDVLAATHQLGQKNFFDLPACPVTKIRSSQYSVDPEQVVRVVFDMTGECVYQIKSDEKGVEISFPDPQGKSFASWSSSTWIASQQAKPATVAAAPAPAPTQTPAQTPAPAKSTAQVNNTINSDRLASLEGQPSAATAPTKTAVPAKATPAASTPVPTKAAATNATVPAKTEASKPAAAKPPVATTPTPVPTTVAATPSKTTPERKPSVPVVAKPDTLTSDVPRQPDLKIDPPQPMMVADAETPSQPTSPKPAVQPTAKAAAPKPSATTPADSAVPKPTPTVTKPSPAVTVKPSETPSTPTTATTPAMSPAVPEPAEDNVEGTEEPEPEDLEPAVEQEGDAADQAQRSTARFRRSANSSKIKGTLVAEFPTRLVIKYEDGGHRDPFATLIDETKQYNNPIERRIPNVEGIRLVGVIESDLGNSALFEDKDGYGYILREGDKIQKGYVLRIQPERVFFQIFEYGWSRTVALNLESEY